MQFAHETGISVWLHWFSRYSILYHAITFEMLRSIYGAAFSEFTANSAKGPVTTADPGRIA
jgi:hypothetical protein